MVSKEQVIAVVDAQETAIDNVSVAQLIQKETGNPVDTELVQDILEHDFRIASVGNGNFYSASKLSREVCFFALPETKEVDEGKVGLFGGEMLFFLKPALGQDILELETESGTVEVSLSIEEADYFLIRGLRDWYKEVGFIRDEDAILFSVVDYASSRFRIRRLRAQELTDLLDSELPFEVCEYTETLFRERYEDSSDFSEPQQVTSLLLTMLYREVFDFKAVPCNISFYLSESDNFMVSGNRVQLASEDDEDFSPFYLGGSGEIPTSLREEDLKSLEESLTLLFMDGEPRKAASVLKELKLKYPAEKILNKFLYQAAYFMEIDEDILFYSDEYSEAFPSDPDPFRTRGEVHFKQGDLKKAEEYFDKALQLIHPQDKGFLGELYILLMYLKWELGDEALAIQMAQKALEMVPESEEVMEFLEEIGFTPDAAVLPDKGSVIKVDFKKGRNKK